MQPTGYCQIKQKPWAHVGSQRADLFGGEGGRRPGGGGMAGAGGSGDGGGRLCRDRKQQHRKKQHGLSD